MSAKKLALELSINIKRGDITLEELNEQLAEAKTQMEEMGDDGSDEFKALGVVVAQAEDKVKSFNDELKDTKQGTRQNGRRSEESGHRKEAMFSRMV